MHVLYGDDLHFFGGHCGHRSCYHNGVHKLSTSSLQWAMLSPTTSEDGAPMKKAYCGMVAFKDGEEAILFVVGGSGTTPSSRQPGAQYEEIFSGCVRTNEQHMFTLSTSEFYYTHQCVIRYEYSFTNPFIHKQQLHVP